MLAELQEYASQHPSPFDAKSTMEVVSYLTACNQLFERGILGKKVFIKSANSPILTNIERGFNFFSRWLDVELSKGRVRTLTGCISGGGGGSQMVIGIHIHYSSISHKLYISVYYFA